MASASYEEQAAQAVAALTGSTIERVEIKYTQLILTLTDGRTFMADTCTCCGLELKEVER